MSVIRRETLDFLDLPGRRSADPLGGVPVSSAVRLVELARGESRHAHLHPLSEEVVYVVSGSGRVWIDGTVSLVGPGDIVHIPTATPHATVPDPGSVMELVCFFPLPDLGRNLVETDLVVEAG